MTIERDGKTPPRSAPPAPEGLQRLDAGGLTRRNLLKGGAVLGGAALTSGWLAACEQREQGQQEQQAQPQQQEGGPQAGSRAPAQATDAGKTITWRVQTSWPGGIGLEIFNGWCDSIIEKTGGELAFKPFSAREVVGDFQLFDAVQNGVLEAMNPFTLYWAGRMPASVFLSSYPLGLRTEGEWDTFYYGLGGLELARELFAKFNMFYVGPIHHGANIIHSKVPIRSIDDFKGRKMRLPGGIVAELFQAIGAKTTLLPGSEIFPALEKGTIDVADYVGPAINYALGFHQVTQFIALGPPGFMSVYQPVDLMDLTVGMETWKALPDHLKDFIQREVHAYSDQHFAAIQKADQDAWREFEEAGSVVTRLSPGDVEELTRVAVPLWFKWANKDEDAARVFRIQLDYMMSPSLGYVTPDMVEGLELKGS